MFVEGVQVFQTAVWHFWQRVYLKEEWSYIKAYKTFIAYNYLPNKLYFMKFIQKPLVSDLAKMAIRKTPHFANFMYCLLHRQKQL